LDDAEIRSNLARLRRLQRPAHHLLRSPDRPRRQGSNGASAISYAAWLLWTGANATTAIYAATNLNDVWLAYVSAIYALCCMVVIALTAFKRLTHRRAKDVPTNFTSRSNESDRAWGGHLQAG
jgi:hypothetical protein